MTPIQERLVHAYATLILGGIKTIEEVPLTLKDLVIAEIESRIV
jgi:hypothetical protein